MYRRTSPDGGPTHAGHHRDPTVHCVDGRLEDGAAFLVGECRELARGPARDQPVDSRRHEVVDQRRQSVEVDGAVVAHRRHDRTAEVEGVYHGSGCGAVRI